MNTEQQEQLFSNIAEAMGGIPEHIVQRQLSHFYRDDPAYGSGVAQKPDLSVDLAAAWADLSLADLIQQTSAEAYPPAAAEQSFRIDAAAAD